MNVLVMFICVCCRVIAGDVASCAQNTECSSYHGAVPSCADAATAQAATKVSLQGKLAALCIAAELVRCMSEGSQLFLVLLVVQLFRAFSI